MKTLTRYVVAAAVVVTFLVALKVLIMVPPENDKDPYSERHNEDKGVLLWGRSNEDGHDELSSFGNNNPRLMGEMGRGVILPPGEKTRGEEALKKYNVNVLASDLISLNRKIPDSRPAGCKSVQYPDNLPGTTIVIPFHNEWPSVLLRTVYSIINRTPKQLLEQIILVDDASDLPSLKKDLDHFISEHFPANLVKIVRLPERVGLIRARLEGFSHVTAEVVSFFDSHMEVNTDWLQPLLVEIVRDRRTVAMGHLDYILPDTFEYSFTPGYRTRYGFDWRLIFFETYFLKSQEKGKDVTDPIPGVVMVGPGFAVNADYFREMGTYDEGMKIWGGENLELAWRIWMCGGRLVHMACSKLGHIARPQPYSFPEGRYETEIHNYKRAIEVWMGPYKKLVYEHHPKMKELDAGDLTERLALKNRLQCNDFTWFLKNVWPELYPYGDNATHWGGVKNQKEELCLDNNQYLFLGPEKLAVKDCDYEPETQSFSLTIDHKLRSVLQCVGVQEEGADMVPVLITCHDEPFHTWTYTMKEGEHITWTYTEQFQLKHDQTGLCLQMMANQHLVMQSCKRGEASQIWRFENTGPPTSLANEGQVGSQQQQQQQQQKQKAEQKPQATKSSRDVLDAFQKQLFLEKENWERGANMAGMPAGNLMQGDAAMMHGGVPMMQGGGQMMHGGGQMVQGGAPYLMQGGAPRMMQGGGAPDMMQGGRKAGGAGVQNMQMRGGGAMPGMMQPGPAANMQMMHGGGGVPAMQRGGGMPALQGAGGMPIMQGAGGMPVMQGGGGMPAMQRGGGMPAMQGAGGMPVMQGAGGMPAMPRGGAMAGGGAHRMQGGGAVPMMQGGGAMPIAGGAGMSRNGGHMQGGGAPVRGGAGNAYNAQPQMKMAGAQNMNAVPLNKRSVGGPKAKHFAGGAQQAMDQVDMQEMMNRQLYAEAKRAGRAR